MNERERYHATMHYQARDRIPMFDFNYWTETVPAWHEQGLPKAFTRENCEDAFGLDGFEKYRMTSIRLGSMETNLLTADVVGGGYNCGLCPQFERKVVEDRGHVEVLQQADGVHVLRGKTFSAIPHPERYILVDRESWRRHYKPRLDPTTPRRFPENWQKHVEMWQSPQRDYPLFLVAGSLFGWVRNWMGLEQVSYVVHDDPAWFEEMIETITDCITGVLERVLSSGVQFEAASMWEDMCFNAGPLISPAHFKKYLVPNYRRISDLLLKHGVDILYLDSDGDISRLVPLWLEGGVNTMMPMETGVWGADVIQYRKEYGKDLRMFGGFDKRILTSTFPRIAYEVRRLAPLVEEGGYIPFCDHQVPPDVPLRNYVYFFQHAREVWCHNANLRPMHPALEALLA